MLLMNSCCGLALLLVRPSLNRGRSVTVNVCDALMKRSRGFSGQVGASRDYTRAKRRAASLKALAGGGRRPGGMARVARAAGVARSRPAPEAARTASEQGTQPRSNCLHCAAPPRAALCCCCPRTNKFDNSVYTASPTHTLCNQRAFVPICDNMRLWSTTRSFYAVTVHSHMWGAVHTHLIQVGLTPPPEERTAGGKHTKLHKCFREGCGKKASSRIARGGQQGPGGGQGPTSRRAVRTFVRGREKGG